MTVADVSGATTAEPINAAEFELVLLTVMLVLVLLAFEASPVVALPSLLLP
jgi:hypothetical protein